MCDLTLDKTDAYDYPLDPAFIADAPVAVRDQSRLLVYSRQTKRIEHQQFTALSDYLTPRDILVFNNTRVLPVRLKGFDLSGKCVEMLLLAHLGRGVEQGVNRERWSVLVKGRRSPCDLIFDSTVKGRLISGASEEERTVEVDLPIGLDLETFLNRHGEVPLPPYILKKRGRRGEDAADRARYQTVYATEAGSAAAPTAGLHFTETLLQTLRGKGIETATLTLHIGLDTFQPIRTEQISHHPMHQEWLCLSDATAAKINRVRARGGRVFAVGTTVTRALESASNPDGTVVAREGKTDLFITPGYRFKTIDALITNFHYPKSTLLVLVSAFAGFQAIQSLYREAIQQKYRFLSFGDAMLIL